MVRVSSIPSLQARRSARVLLGQGAGQVLQQAQGRLIAGRLVGLVHRGADLAAFPSGMCSVASLVHSATLHEGELTENVVTAPPLSPSAVNDDEDAPVCRHPRATTSASSSLQTVWFSVVPLPEAESRCLSPLIDAQHDEDEVLPK